VGNIIGVSIVMARMFTDIPYPFMFVVKDVLQSLVSYVGIWNFRILSNLLLWDSHEVEMFWLANRHITKQDS